jgi:hypothetical protein
MTNEQFYDPNWPYGESSGRDEYYGRSQSRLSKLAQHSQQAQSSSIYRNDLQSTLNQELDMMEQKLMQFQEDSTRRSQELLDQLETFSRREGLRRREGRANIAASVSTDGPYIGSFANDIDSELHIYLMFSYQLH